MTSFDYRLNPIYAIKECSSCGSLYTSNCGCSKGSLEDKILVPKPPRNCARCGTPVDGPYCQGCALLRKEFMEGLFTNCVENEFFKDFQDTSESSDDNTNVVNAPREPFVGNQDPGENSSPSPLHIDHCCHECGDSLDGIFCRQCTCVEADFDPKGDICFIENLMYDNSFPRPSKTLKDDYEFVIDSNNDYSSSDDDSYKDIDYVDASPPHSELVSLEEVKDFHPEDGEIEDDILCEKLLKINLLIAKIEALNANPTPSSDFMLKSPIPVEDGDSFLEKFETTPELETFKFDIEEKNSGSTTIHADISLPDLECFYFKSKPDPGELTSIVDSGIRENVSSTTNVNLPFEDDQSPLFAYVVWIFLPFLTYPVAPPYLLSCGNEDTIFDPGISVYHSFMPSVSHQSGTFMKFNVYPNNLNESPMEILSSTCSPMDQ
ncbi:hypothetical protein Tco_0134254 [Tanacetum coccineum]